MCGEISLAQKDLNQETGELKRVQFYPWANFDKWQWALDKKEVKKKEKKGNYTFEIRLVNGAKAKKWTV